jgi:hypothetical protein
MYSRQADFIHGVAVIDESFSGIDHWWIGLTDLGMYCRTSVLEENVFNAFNF